MPFAVQGLIQTQEALSLLQERASDLHPFLLEWQDAFAIEQSEYYDSTINPLPFSSGNRKPRPGEYAELTGLIRDQSINDYELIGEDTIEIGVISAGYGFYQDLLAQAKGTPGLLSPRGADPVLLEQSFWYWLTRGI